MSIETLPCWTSAVVYQDIDPLFGSLGDFDTVPLQLADLTRSLGHWQSGLAAASWNNLHSSRVRSPVSVTTGSSGTSP